MPSTPAPLPRIDPSWPVVVAYGAGVDSTAMLVELIESGQRVDAVLFADVGDEKQATYDYLALFTAWLKERGVPLHVVRYAPKRFKNFPEYGSLFENLLTNGTLPGITFGRGTCSAKWKIAPQDAWITSWSLAADIWGRGGRVVRLIGYDSSPADRRRYAHAVTLQTDERYAYRYPLIELGWTRSDCEARIAAAGLPVPLKSSCTFCSAMHPAEVDALDPVWLRRIVLLEARAKPRLRNVDGLWRKPVVGARGATPRPGSMTEYIRARGLLPEDEINAIAALAPQELLRFQDLAATAEVRPKMSAWVELFDRAAAMGLNGPGASPLYPERTQTADRCSSAPDERDPARSRSCAAAALG